MRTERSAGRDAGLNRMLLAGLVAGLTAALVGGGIWLAFRERKPTPTPYKETDGYKMMKAIQKSVDDDNARDRAAGNGP